MHKIFSYLLLCVGVLIILFALQNMYKAFIGAASVTTLVHFADLTIQTKLGPATLPMDAVNLTANLLLFAIFMIFLVIVGTRLAGLGCQILKAERIHDALSQLKRSELSEEKLKNL